MGNLKLSLCDMKELYSLVLEECPSELPTIIVVKNMADAFKGAKHKFFLSKSGCNKVVLIFEEADLQTMKSNLKIYLEEFKNLDIITLDVMPIFGIQMYGRNFVFESLAHRKEIYQHAISISQHLGIVCPQIIAMRENNSSLETAVRITFFDESIIDKDIPIGDVVIVMNRGRSRQVHSIAHELRHCWQEYRSSDDFYKNYKHLTNSNLLEYAKQKEEIDAEAYACLYTEKHLGVSDGTSLMYDSRLDAMFCNDYTRKVKEHMKTIHI